MIARLKAVALAGKAKCRQSLWTIPFLFTFANALLGFLAVIKALDADFTAAAYCILLAAFMDGCDGRLARAFGSTSEIGTELDSLCDAISFCVSPAILLYSWELQDYGMFGLIVLGIYLCAGLVRLAKFNTGSDHQSLVFLGLPTTVAAFGIASFILYEDWIAVSRLSFLLNKPGLIVLIALISFLMVSTIRFPGIKQYRLKSFAMLGIMALVSCIFIVARIYSLPFVLMMLASYFGAALIAPIYLLIQRLVASKF